MRDKLTELLKNATTQTEVLDNHGNTKGTRPLPLVTKYCAGILADYLIANGVTMQQWIPVSERPPEHGVNVLCRTMFGMRVMHWNENAELWVDDEAAHSKRFVDYWLSIPEDPEEDE